MEAIAERGHSAMIWLLGLGMIAGWAACDAPVPVIETAASAVDAAFASPELLRDLGINGDALNGLSFDVRTPLDQYRHKCLQTDMAGAPSAHALKLELLRPMRAEIVFVLCREALKRVQEAILPQYETLGELRPTKELLAISERTRARSEKLEPLVKPLRDQLGRLEAWHHKSGLGPTATFEDIAAELEAKIQVPGTEQSIAVQKCMVFLGLGIVAIELYLISLLGTVAELPSDEAAGAHSWLLLHHGPLGPVLMSIWLAAPGLAWLVQQILQPLARQGLKPSLGVSLQAGAIVITSVVTLAQMWRARRRHRPSASNPVLGSLNMMRAA